MGELVVHRARLHEPLSLPLLLLPRPTLTPSYSLPFTAPKRRKSKKKRSKSKTLQNAASSSSSWSSPLQRQRTTSIDHNSNTLPTEKKSQLNDNEAQRPQEENGKANGKGAMATVNSTRNGVANKQRAKPDLSRAKSETTLSEERKENVPVSHDDLPIRPAKNGGPFIDEYGGGGMGSAKSISHHSLPITAPHAALRQQHSQPPRKAPFLRSGSNNRVKPQASLRGAPVLAPRQATQAIHNADKVSGSPSVQTALRKMESEDWNEKVDGINMISDLSSRNPQSVADNLSDVVAAVLNECGNLRSSVSRVAIVCMGTLHTNLAGKMDSVTDKTTAVLMARSGDVSSAFIRDDATEAIEAVAKHGNPPRVLTAIINHGIKSKNNTIRTASSSLISQLVARIGPSQALQNGDFLTKLIPTLICLSKDTNPKVRQHAKLVLISLSQESSFDRQMRKYVSDGDFNAVRGIIGDVHKKGGVEALESSSASAFSRNGSVRKSINRKVPDNLQLDLDEIKDDLNASGWERRLTGLKRFEEMTTTSARAIATHTTLIEAFIARLSDINSKVSLAAMSAYMSTLPSMARYYSSEASLKAVLNQLLFALSSHLPSRSEEHRHLAQSALQETMKQIDPAALSSHFAAVTKKANVKQRPFLLHLFTKLNSELYKSKPKQVEVVALPILWDCLRTPAVDADNKRALGEFARGLSRLLGERALGEAAASALDAPKRKALDGILA